MDIKYKTPITAAVVLPCDLIAEVLSYLPVKILLRFRCVSKYWKTLISDPVFVKLHFNRSASRNPQFTLVTHHGLDIDSFLMSLACSVVPYSMHRLIENPSFTHSVIDPDCYFSHYEGNYHTIVGSCNGLICLLAAIGGIGGHEEYKLRLWNPATRTTKDFGYFRDDAGSSQRGTFLRRDLFKFNFGCDKSTDTYKVVASRYNPEHQLRSNVKILSLSDNVWRDIESFPVVPLEFDYPEDYERNVNCGVYLSGTLNWLAIHNHLRCYSKDIKIEQFVIVSLDLGTETYNNYLLPRDFDEVPSEAPTISVLGGCLCFSYSKDTYFVIWRMMKFGVEDSWTQFFKISYQDLPIYHDTFGYMPSLRLVPLLLYEDGHILIIKSGYNENNYYENNAILYNCRDNKVGQTEITTSTDTKDYICWYSTMDYAESLVSVL